ncbi:MAG: sodium ion-translocating decarboxylase subunit beta [Clostridia bacterium]|nr:sodium ion-translocating decarboxylase subunit beta [Clostridia bacterium]
MEFLLEGFKALADNPKMIAMWAIGGLLIYLAIKKDMEPALLLPMGFGAILVNLPLSPVIAEGEHIGIISALYKVGIATGEAMPLLLFIGIGCMIDFGPLLTNPKLFILGGAAQLGIFITIILATMIGFPLSDAASIGIIGAADGPTAILVAQTLKTPYIGAIMVVAYSYMALVPIVQPAVIKACTTKKERLIRMKYSAKQVSKLMRILFPIIVTVVSGLIAPDSLSLVGMLMFGNLLRECGVLKSLSETAQTTFSNIITLLLGITIAFQMQAEAFLSFNTLIIMGLGLFAFVFDTFGGVMCAKIMNLFSKEKINPMLGAAGISAFPMASRVVAKMGTKEDPSNHLLMHAVGANVSGQIASAIVGGLIIGILF